MELTVLIEVVIAFAVGGVASVLALRLGGRDVVRNAREQSARILAEAEDRRRALEIEGQEEALRHRRQAEEELREQRREAGRVERRLEQREETLERRSETLERGEQ